VTGEQASEVEAVLRWAIAAGMYVAHSSEDEPWTEVTCMSCGAEFAARWPPWHGLRSLRRLRDFVVFHTMSETGAEEL
jgi:hypothetical protein